ncbi:MAG: ornithine cyclodeaminase family protein [Gemmatimonadota bacterium]|nr:MAG: ornithine cyclodeaminase family protein [Gemmatimonadota bacterium]
MDRPGTLLLSRDDIASLLTLKDCIGGVEEAFRAHADGRSIAPGLLHGEAASGEFHIKGGGFQEPTPYYALKANAGFFRNTEQYGLPNIQGLILLFSAENGKPLAVMDSGGITVKRTGAATAVVAKYLARADSRTVTMCGCGTQGRIQLKSLCEVLPIEHVNAYSIDEDEAANYAADMSRELGMRVEHALDLERAVRECDICITCTPAKKAYISQEFVTPGTLVVAVGADSPDKQEIDPKLLAANHVVVDLLDQCVSVGELHHAIEAGLMTAADVRAELADVVAGKTAGRWTDDEIIVFDSTGTALQDAAAAILVYERALNSGHGTRFSFV